MTANLDFKSCMDALNLLTTTLPDLLLMVEPLTQ
ncbi:hypothetical protein KR100_03070 [Synechococcus sp. KORDI-100]|nr:hypothetical protein KR100_03070 [Synechococcus sp. KORDI-100]